jgi:hypothetical protein
MLDVVRRLTRRCFTGCTGSVDLFYVDAMEGGTGGEWKWRK